MTRKIYAIGVLILVLGTSLTAHAVIIGSGNGTQNTTQPAGVAGWFNVGRIGLGGGVYLGNGWVLTANHLGNIASHPSITFYPTDQFPNGSVSYALDVSTQVQLHNPDQSATDLILVRTLTDPGLPALSLPSATPAPGTALTIVGFGVNRGRAVQYDSAWHEVASGGAQSGFLLNPLDTNTPGGFAKRWGTSKTSAFPDTNVAEIAGVNGTFTNVFTAPFLTPVSPNDSTAIGVSGDSGGAVFSTSSPNTLLGIILYQDYLNVPAGQPYDANNGIGTVIFGNGLDAGNLAAYSGQIQAIVSTPEPSTALLLGCGIALMARRRR